MKCSVAHLHALSNADKDWFNYFYETYRQAMANFSDASMGRGADPQSCVEGEARTIRARK